MRRIALFGASGSIGRQTLDVVRRLKYDLVAVSVHNNTEALASIYAEFRPKYVVITGNAAPPAGVKPLYGREGLVEVAESEDVDTVVVATNGIIGVFPTLAALKRGKRVALANKETLVAFGPFVREVADLGELVPIDSEHSSAFQLLNGVKREEVKKLILTASGGPFRTWPKERIAKARPEDALRHPTWRMGAKITVDSATLMNKGLEVIEAHFLFDLSADEIDVRIHPQSAIHAILLLKDNSLKMHVSRPDMRIPIQYALTYPGREEIPIPPYLPPDEEVVLTLEMPDTERFPALALAYRALRLGGTYPAVLNAANEVAVFAFLEGRIGFYDITAIVERVMEENPFAHERTFEGFLKAHEWAARRAKELVSSKS
ncbi:MAG: 1-deoxy-D-xylulose-5-phosphate reductoisomerase [Thermotogae bacterium]|nr:1-deoxy-D-xylulose-5-phosphate reductoisomerase [Thermotogota bacterium]